MKPADRDYGAEVGEEALERQQRLAKDRHACCGEWKNGPHHESCRHFVADAAPAKIPGQETLL